MPAPRGDLLRQAGAVRGIAGGRPRLRAGRTPAAVPARRARLGNGADLGGGPGDPGEERVPRGPPRGRGFGAGPLDPGGAVLHPPRRRLEKGRAPPGGRPASRARSAGARQEPEGRVERIGQPFRIQRADGRPEVPHAVLRAAVVTVPEDAQFDRRFPSRAPAVRCLRPQPVRPLRQQRHRQDGARERPPERFPRPPDRRGRHGPLVGIRRFRAQFPRAEPVDPPRRAWPPHPDHRPQVRAHPDPDRIPAERATARGRRRRTDNGNASLRPFGRVPERRPRGRRDGVHGEAVRQEDHRSIDPDDLFRLQPDAPGHRVPVLRGRQPEARTRWSRRRRRRVLAAAPRRHQRERKRGRREPNSCARDGHRPAPSRSPPGRRRSFPDANSTQGRWLARSGPQVKKADRPLPGRGRGRPRGHGCVAGPSRAVGDGHGGPEPARSYRSITSFCETSLPCAERRAKYTPAGRSVTSTSSAPRYP